MVKLKFTLLFYSKFHLIRIKSNLLTSSLWWHHTRHKATNHSSACFLSSSSLFVFKKRAFFKICLPVFCAAAKKQTGFQTIWNEEVQTTLVMFRCQIFSTISLSQTVEKCWLVHSIRMPFNTYLYLSCGAATFTFTKMIMQQCIHLQNYLCYRYLSSQH